MLILGIDHFLDMARTVTHVLGNSIATAVVAKWENAIVPVSEELAESDAVLPLASEQQPAALAA